MKFSAEPSRTKQFLLTTKAIIATATTFNQSLQRSTTATKNIIITKKEDYKAEGATVVHSISEALNEVESDTAFIIGGGDIYRQFLPKAEKLYLTEIEAECPDADAYFPAFNKAEYKKELLASYHDKGIHFSHICYTKK
jgi:dihydrofolate reductase